MVIIIENNNKIEFIVKKKLKESKKKTKGIVNKSSISYNNINIIICIVLIDNENLKSLIFKKPHS